MANERAADGDGWMVSHFTKDRTLRRRAGYLSNFHIPEKRSKPGNLEALILVVANLEAHDKNSPTG